MKTRFSPGVQSFLLTLITGVCLAGVCATGAEPAVNTAQTASAPVESAQPTIMLRATKIRIAPGEEQTFTLTLGNPTTSEVQGQVKLWVEHGVDQRLPLADQTEALAAGQTRGLTFSWTPESELWGCRVVAAWDADGQQHESSDVFSVTKISNIWAASPIYKTLPNTNMNNAAARLAEQVESFRRQGALIVELFNWQPTHFGGMTPLPDKPWINGMSPSRRSFSRKTIRMAEQSVHAQGMAFISYAIICHCGPVGHAWLESHPEDALYPTKDIKNPLKPEYGSVATANSLRRETLDQALAEYIKVARDFHFDGIRWDGHPGTPYHPLFDNMFRMNGQSRAPGFDSTGKPIIPEDPDALNLEIDEHVQNVFRKAFPDFLFGYNYSGFATAEYSPRYMLNPRSFLSTCAGNMILDEKQMNPGRDGSGVPGQVFCRTWSMIRSLALNTADLVRSLGGFPYRGPIYDAKNEAFQKICYSIFFASAIHPMSGGNLVPAWGQFALRYNKLLFHPSLIRGRNHHFSIPVSVISGGPFAPFYENYIYSQYTDGHYRQIVHVLNDPGGDEVNMKRQRKITWPISGAGVTMGLPQGLSWNAMRFWALSPEFENWKVELKPTFDKTGVHLVLPDFNYWCMVVMDVPVNKDTIIWDANADPWLIDVEQDPSKGRKAHE